MRSKLYVPQTLVLMLALFSVTAPSVSEAQSLDPLTVQVTTDKSDYKRGEQMLLTLQVTNRSSLPVTISFSNGKRYDFAARDANGNTLWTWSTGKTFDPAGSQQTLAPGASLSYQESWTFVADDGQPVLDGAYTVSGTFLGNYLGRSGPKQGEQTVTLVTPDSIEATFSTDKSSYGLLDRAVLTLTITNISPNAVTVVFSSSQLYDFTATNSAGATVWTWSNGKTFDPTPRELVLAPGETREFKETWTLVNNSGMRVSSGTYTVSGTFLGTYYGQVGSDGGEAQVQVRAL